MNYREIYDKAFTQVASYRLSDEESILRRNPTYCFVLDWLKKNPSHLLMDIGSGRGVLIRLIQQLFSDITITAIDLNNYNTTLDSRFIQADLSLESDREVLRSESCELLTCMDVLEHLEKKVIDPVLQLFSEISETAIFSIANHSSMMDGIDLHIIQENDKYWTTVISKWFDIECLEFGNRVMFYRCRRRC